MTIFSQINDNIRKNDEIIRAEFNKHFQRIRRVEGIQKLALARLANRQGRLTDLNTQAAAKEAVEHATRAYDAVVALEIPDA
ncbi:MAG: hypothetical protein J6N20_13825 [Pseudomonas sp.]|nr:hypothetical protein [Pseudomonas sp.]